MTTSKIQITLDDRLIVLLGDDKSANVREALVQLYRVDRTTLLVTQPKPLVVNTAHPKKWVDCLTIEEKIAFKEGDGYELGGDPLRPTLWVSPTGAAWHHDTKQAVPAQVTTHHAATKRKVTQDTFESIERMLPKTMTEDEVAAHMAQFEVHELTDEDIDAMCDVDQ